MPSLTTAAEKQAAATRARPAPPEAAAMVCSHEIHLDVQQVTGDTTVAMGRASWDGTLYRCTYRLATGRLVMTVHVAKTVAAAQQDFTARRMQLRPSRELRGIAGLGLPAFESGSAVVVFRKGADTLMVDATKLPPEIGPQQRPRADIAYALATDVIACWREG